MQNGLNALHKAARKGHSDVVKHLITTKKFKVNSGDKVCRQRIQNATVVLSISGTVLRCSLPFQYGWTPLHWAAWNGHSGTVQTLVENNSCYVNSVDKVQIQILLLVTVTIFSNSAHTNVLDLIMM